MPYCSQCGAEVDDKTKFCPDCGAPIKKREKRAAIIPPINLPSPKNVHGELHPASYQVERAEESRSQERGVPTEKPKYSKAAPQPTGTTIGPTEKSHDKDMQAQMRKDKIKGGLVAAAIIIGVFLIVPPMVLGYPIWEIFDDGGGGGGGSPNWDGLYYGNTITVSPMGSTSGSGSFNVVNGYVSEGWFEGSVNSSGWFTGTIIISAGSPAMTVTGQFSLTNTFTLYGSYGSSSWTCYAYKA